MTDRRIKQQVEKSSFGTAQAKAARSSVSAASAARVVAMAEAKRRSTEKTPRKSGG